LSVCTFFSFSLVSKKDVEEEEEEEEGERELEKMTLTPIVAKRILHSEPLLFF
jgi:hypothetical protein